MFLKNILIAFVAFQFLAVPILFVMDSQFLQSVLALAIGFAVIYFLTGQYFGGYKTGSGLFLYDGRFGRRPL